MSDYTNSTIDWQQESIQDGMTIGIEVYDKNDQYMIDEHFASLFPELENIDIMDENEGFMSYEGDLSAIQLVDKLITMGFNTKLV